MSHILAPGNNHSKGTDPRWLPHVTVASIARRGGIYQFVAGNGETYQRFTFSGELIEQQKNYIPDPAIEEVQWLDRKTLETPGFRMRSDVVLKCITDFEAGNRLPAHCVQQLKRF